jgi:hypothetical protein
LSVVTFDENDVVTGRNCSPPSKQFLSD